MSALNALLLAALAGVTSALLWQRRRLRRLTRAAAERSGVASALARREAQYRMLAENANDMISHHTRGGVYLYASPACERLLGYRPEELVGRSAYELFHPDDLSAIQRSHQAIVADAVTYRVSYRIRRKDGHYIWFETISNATGTTAAERQEIVAISRDISERKAVEEALAASERRYRTLVEQASDGIFLIDSAGRMVEVNQAACRMLGYDRVELMALRREDLLAPHEIPRAQALRASLAQSGNVHGQLRVLTKAREERVIDVSAVPIEPDLALIIARDVTERVRMEEELRHSHQQLRELSAHLQEVREEEKASIARELHDELGSTLTALKMDLVWLEETVNDSAPARERLAALDRLVDEAVATVRRIVSELRPTLLDDLGLGPAVDWLASELSRHSGILCRTEVAIDEAGVPPGTALALFRIVQEALTNVARHAGAHEVRIDCWQDADELCLTVEDDGRGMDARTAVQGRSHGLRGIQERLMQLDGTLEIHAVPGEGTMLSIRVPLPREEAP